MLELVKKGHVHYTDIKKKAVATCLRYATSDTAGDSSVVIASCTPQCLFLKDKIEWIRLVGRMAKEKDVILMFDKPDFVVKLHEYVLEVDLKEGVKKKLEALLESHQLAKKSLGFIFQVVVPLDVWLKDIESVTIDKNGATQIAIPGHKDIAIPLEPDESKKLVGTLNELIPIAKRKDMQEKKILKKMQIKL